MARYPSDHKQNTRRRIIERAGRRFKRDGVDGSGIGALMSDASLTNGAFYTHFASKDDLVASVVRDQLRAQRKRYGSVPFDRATFDAFVRHYLSGAHRVDLEGGCPSAALLEDIIRGDEGARRAYHEGMLPMIDDIASMIPTKDRTDARARAATVFATMMGILQVARALDDALAEAVLCRGTDSVLGLLDRHIVDASAQNPTS